MFLASDNFHLSKPRISGQPIHAIGLEATTAKVQRYVEASAARNTHKAYNSDLKLFLAWGGGIPADAELVAEYIADHGESHAAATIERWLAAISKAHTSRNLSTPTTAPIVQATLKGIRRVHGVKQKQAAAITEDELVKLSSNLGDSAKDLRDKALLLVGFAGAFRRSELVGIDVEDLGWKPEGLVVRVGKSKTDQEGEGREVFLASTNDHGCAVVALREWLDHTGIDGGPVFRSVSRYGRAQAKRLSSEAVAVIIKKLAKNVGLDPKQFSGHSLRAGYVTTAAKQGQPIWQIKRQTGHRSDSIVDRYIRT